MSPTQLKAIAVSLAVLLLLWGGSELLSRGSDTTTGSLALPALAQADADTISIVSGPDSVLLAKQSSSAWTVNGHRAAPDEVHALFQALRDTVRPELVAQDSSSFARLGVDSAAARWLRIRGGGKLLLQLALGTRRAEVQGAYVRRPGDTHVYLWRGRLGGLADRRADEWRDKRVAALEPDSIGEVDVERGKERYALRRRAGRWSVDGAAADSAAVARLLEKYRAITAMGFATRGAGDSTKARRPVRRLAIRDARGGMLLSLAFDSTTGSFLVRHVAGAGGEGPTVYRMSVWEVDGVTPVSRSLLPTKK